jgi:hypothetical protein
VLIKCLDKAAVIAVIGSRCACAFPCLIPDGFSRVVIACPERDPVRGCNPFYVFDSLDVI